MVAPLCCQALIIAKRELMVNQNAINNTMPRLSLYRPNRTRDYQFLDRTIREMYTVGGVDIYVHKYMGPETGGEDSAFSGNADATQPVYDELSPLNIQDLLLLENRDRIYDQDIYVMRGVYNAQDVDFDLSQFGLFLNNDTLFITFHYNNMIDVFQRKLMVGDVLELPNLKDYYPLNSNIPEALPKYYVIQDAAFASEGFSQTWLPHLWRVKATPLTNAQEYKDVLKKPMVKSTIWDNDNFYPAGDIVNQGNVYYQARVNVPAGTDITNTTYWREYTPGTESELMSTRTKDQQINDAILTQADVEVPKSGYDATKMYVVPTTLDGQPANPVGLTTDGATTVDGTEGGMNLTPDTDGYTAGYLTGDGIPPNGFPTSAGVSFPENNTYTVKTTDMGNIPSRQSLSEILKPRADNGDDNGNKPPNPYPDTRPGQRSS